jgi:CPA2 family monovalent cation:H+ antiporter-2
MIETFLLRDLTVVVTIAAAMTLLCHRFHQPVVIGYLVAGLIIGPYTPPLSLVHDLHSIHAMAELGLVFLMFALGLEFCLPKLRKVWISAVLGASFGVLGMLVIGYFLGRLFGWSYGDSIFLGAILSMSSTTIIVKVFMDLKLLKEDFAQVVFGILILEDIVAVLILSVLSGIGVSGEDKAFLLASSMSKVFLFIVLFLVFGFLLVPRFLHWVAKFNVKEMMGIVVLGLCLTGSFLATIFGFSVALGAFLIGAVVAASDEITQIEDWIHPVRDMFSAIFFVSAGMLIQPHILWEYKWPIIIITLATLLGKIVTDAAGSFLSGLNLKTSFKIGVSLGQIGEFSFVIASLGASLKVTSEFFFPLAVAVSSLTTLCTPYLIRNADGIVGILMRITPNSFQYILDRKQSSFFRPKGASDRNSKASVPSKYLIRLVVYTTVLIGIVLFTQVASRIILLFCSSTPNLKIYLFLLWMFSCFISLPFFILIAKYANHIFLLLATKIPMLLRMINVHYFYNTMFSILFGIMGYIYLLMANNVLHYWWRSWQLIGLVFLFWVLMRSKISIIAEWMEKLLDEILGLASSEPTRRAIMTAENFSFLDGVMEPVSLSDTSPALQKTIRSINLREHTGVSVVAIYRGGKHIANPSPDTILLPNDILIIIGNIDERHKAKSLLLKKESPDRRK